MTRAFASGAVPLPTGGFYCPDGRDQRTAAVRRDRCAARLSSYAPPGQPVTVMGPNGQPIMLRSPVPGFVPMQGGGFLPPSPVPTPLPPSPAPPDQR